MPTPSDFDLMLRLAVACLLGGIVGMEREQKHRGAGLKTHCMVSLGAALFTVISIAFTNPAGNNDPGRVAAQVVSGIGFLGAGTIMKHGTTVRGLTTAATLWLVAGIGMAAGVGHYKAAVLTTGLAMIVLTLFRSLEKQVRDRRGVVLELKIPREGGHLARIYSAMEERGVAVKRAEVDTEEEDQLMVRMVVMAPSLDRVSVKERLLEAGALEVRW